jgi:hypothetical protein
VAEKYNLIVGFLQGYNQETREFLSFIIEGMIPKLQSIDEIESIIDYLQSLEHSIIDIGSRSKESTSQIGIQEQRLKLKLGKPSIDWLLDHLPEPVDLTRTSNIDQTVTEGFDSQISLVTFLTILICL